jgi:SWIM zinc finger
MTSLPHPLPSRMAQNVAALFGHADDTLVAWQRACVQAAEALRPQHESERLAKALTLAQDGAVVLEDDGTATVQGSSAQPYTVSGALCDCPDAKKRGTPCKHALAVAIHQQAMALLAPSASSILQLAATTPPPPALAQTTRQVRPPSADRWDVTEAPASCCLRLRVGELELMYTMRDVSDAELTGRVQHLVPWVQDLLDQARERQAQLEAQRQQRAAAKVAPDAPAQPPVPTSPPASVPADLQALLQQAVQQALAAANGQAPSTPPPAALSTSQRQAKAKTGDQATGFCSLHQVAMEHRENERGSWYSHWLPEEERHCKGRR